MPNENKEEFRKENTSNSWEITASEIIPLCIERSNDMKYDTVTKELLTGVYARGSSPLSVDLGVKVTVIKAEDGGIDYKVENADKSEKSGEEIGE